MPIALSELQRRLMALPECQIYSRPDIIERAKAFHLWWVAKDFNLRTVDFRSGMPVPTQLLDQLIGQISQGCIHVKWNERDYIVIGLDIWALPTLGEEITVRPKSHVLVLARVEDIDLFA